MKLERSWHSGDAGIFALSARTSQAFLIQGDIPALCFSILGISSVFGCVVTHIHLQWKNAGRRGFGQNIWNTLLLAYVEENSKLATVAFSTKQAGFTPISLNVAEEAQWVWWV